jgi:hypothetical protein
MISIVSIVLSFLLRRIGQRAETVRVALGPPGAGIWQERFQSSSAYGAGDFGAICPTVAKTASR